MSRGIICFEWLSNFTYECIWTRQIWHFGQVYFCSGCCNVTVITRHFREALAATLVVPVLIHPQGVTHEAEVITLCGHRVLESPLMEAHEAGFTCHLRAEWFMHRYISKLQLCRVHGNLRNE